MTLTEKVKGYNRQNIVTILTNKQCFFCDQTNIVSAWLGIFLFSLNNLTKQICLPNQKLS